MSDPAESGPPPAPGADELLIRRRYEVLSTSTTPVALWFIVGSILFFSLATATAGT